MNKKVIVGRKYRYMPVMLDQLHPPAGVQSDELHTGDIVKVVNLPGCPKANTMGHCHINKDSKFMGLVCCNSLLDIE